MSTQPEQQLTNPAGCSALKPRSANTLPAPERSLAYVWARMASRYGALWTNHHGDAPASLDAAEWGSVIRDLNEDQIRRGFSVDLDRGSDFPPSGAKFRAMCLPPVSDAPRTYLGGPAPKRTLTAIESERAKTAADRELTGLCAKLGIDRAAIAGKRP